MAVMPPAAYDPNAKLSLGAACWSLFEGVRNPYVILITIYIFAPYLAQTVVGDPVKGQEVISQWSQYSGWAVMATAPFLGASIDKLGRRKVWLALIVVLMVPLTAALWFTKADHTGLSVTYYVDDHDHGRNPLHLVGSPAQFPAGPRRRALGRSHRFWTGAGAWQFLRSGRACLYGLGLRAARPAGDGDLVVGASRPSVRTAEVPSRARTGGRVAFGPDLRNRRPAVLPVHAGRAVHGRPGADRSTQRRLRPAENGPHGGSLPQRRDLPWGLACSTSTV